MSDNLEQLIRERAHSLWEADGCPPGRDQEYWFRAEQMLREERDPKRPDMNKDPV
ncbi:MAG: DUF2934 domain-containing protein [Acetobacteraceae bacterium]|nr:DUF2934 domain-containing protein [Acetobacteraceae bacterium]